MAFLLPNDGGKKDENRILFSWQKSSALFPSSDWLGSFRLKNLACDFTTYISEGIFTVTINFRDKLWETVVATVYNFYCQQIAHAFLIEPLPRDNFHTEQLFPGQEDHQIQ